MVSNNDNSKETSDTQLDDSESAALIVNEVLQDSSEQLAEHSISSAHCENQLTGIVLSTLDKTLTSDCTSVEDVSNGKAAGSSHDRNNEEVSEIQNARS